MKAYSQMSKEELLALKSDLEKAYDEFKARGLKLDMSRGKPSAEQMDLSMGRSVVAIDCLSQRICSLS